MLFAFLYSCLRLLLDVVDVRLRRNESEAELLLLRHEIRVLRRQINRPRLTTADRIVMATFHRLVSRPALGGLVQPETVLGWHRELVRRKWAAFGRRRGVGRPGLEASVRELILTMARENPRWGCIRIRGELLKVGHRVSATAIRNLLRRNRLGPAPQRSGPGWRSFLRAQASAIVVSDFFSVDTVFLRRLYVLLYMELASRRIVWFGVTANPDSAWGRSAEPQPGLAAGGTADSISDPRPRRQVRRTQRRRIASRGHPGNQDCDRGAEGQCLHGATDRFGASRVPGLDLALRASTPRAGDGRMDRALQCRSAASRSGFADSRRQVKSARCCSSGTLPQPPRRFAARVLERANCCGCLTLAPTNMCAPQPRATRLNYLRYDRR